MVGGVGICGSIEKVKDLREVPGWNRLLGRGLSVHGGWCGDLWQYRESKGFKGGVRLELFVR